MKMPSDTFKGFDNVFNALEQKVESVKGKLQQGFKTTGEINSFKRELAEVKDLYVSLAKSVKGIDVGEVFKGIDSPELEAARQHLAELENQLKQLTSTEAFTKLNSEVDALKESLGHAPRKGVYELIEDLQSGDLDAAAQKVKELQQAISKLKEGDTKTGYTNFLTRIGLDPEKMGTDLEEIKKQINDVFNGDQVRAAAAGIEEWQTKVHSLEISNIEDLENLIKRIVQQLLQSNQGWTSYQRNVDGTVEKSKQLNSELDQFKNRIQYFFGMNNAVRLFQRALRSAYETVKDLDKVMTQTAVVTDFSVSDMWSQLPEYTARANELGVTIHDVYEASTLYYQQGLKTNEVMAVTNATLRMARIAGLEAAEATDRVTNALRGFNMEITEANANNIADVYSKLAAISASNVDEISTAMTKTASLASSANMEFETTAAFLAQIIETTRESAETAGTALKTVIARFSEVKKLYSEGELLGTDAEGEEIDVNKVSVALRTAGINLNEFLTGTKGLDDVFMELASKWDSLTIVQQRYIATMAAGSRQQSRFIALMSDYARTQELVNAAENASGASMEQYEKTLDSLETKLNQLKNAWDEFVMGLAKDEAIKWVVDAIKNLIGFVNKLTDKLPGLLKTVARIGLAFGSFKGLSAIFDAFLKTVGTKLGTRAETAGEQTGKSFGSGIQRGFEYFWPNVEKQFGIRAESVRQVFQDAFKAHNIPMDSNLTELLKDPIAKYSDISTELDKLAESSGWAKEEIEQLRAVLNSVSPTAKKSAQELAKIQKGFTSVGAAAMGVGTVLMSLSGILNYLGFDHAAEVTQKWGTSLLAIGSIIPLVGKGIKWLGETAFKAGTEASIGWGKFYIIVAAVVAAIALIAAGAVALDKALHPAREQLKGIESALDQIAESADSTKQEINDLVSAWDTLTNTRDNLDNLIQGTEEWRATLYEVNQEVLDLINKYPELSQYVISGENGGLTFNEEGFNQYLTRLRQQSTTLAQAQLGLEIQRQQVSGQTTAETIYNQRQLNRNGLSREQWNELLAWSGQNGIIASQVGTNDAFRDHLSNSGLGSLQIENIIWQIGILGDEFDQLASEAAQTSVLVDNSVNALVASIETTNAVIDENNANIIRSGLELIDDTAKFQELYNNQVQALPNNIRQLRELYAQNVSGYYSNGKLYSDPDYQNELKLTVEALKQGIASALASSEFADEINQIISNLSQVQNEQLLRLLQGRSTSTELETITLDQINSWASLYDLDSDKIQQYINQLKNDFNEIPISIQQLDLPVKISNYLASIFKQAQATEAEINAFTNIISELLNNVTLSPEDKENLIEQLGLTDFRNIESIDQLITIIKELPSATDFTADQLLELRNAAIEAGNAISKVNFKTLITSIQSLQEKLNNQERSYTQEEVNQYVAGGVDESQFVLYGEDEFHYAGTFTALQNALDANVVNEFANAIENVRSRTEEAIRADEELVEAQQSVTNAQEAYNNIPTWDPNDIPIDIRIEQIDEAWRTGAPWASEIPQNNLFGLPDISSGGIPLTEDDYDSYQNQLNTATQQLTEARNIEVEAEIANAEAQAALTTAEDDLRSLISRYGQTASMDSLNSAIALLDLTDTTNADTVDNALLARAQQYDDLIDLVNNLKKADTEEARTAARAALQVELALKDREKAFEKLGKAIEENLEILKTADRDSHAYARALAEVTAAAQEAFGNDQITTEFVEQNLDAFQALTEGSEEAGNQIRNALIASIVDANSQMAFLGDAIADINNHPLDMAGHFDASQVFSELAFLMGDAEKAAELMRSLGYSVTWLETGDTTTMEIPDPESPEGYRKIEIPNYKAEVIDGFGNAVSNGTFGGGGSGGGGGGGGSKDKKWKNPYDELYNLTERINEALRTRNKLEADYDRILKRRTYDHRSLYEMSLAETDNLYHELELQQQLLNGRQKQLANIGNQKFETEEGEFKTFTEMDVTKYAYYDTANGVVQIDWDGINAIEDTETGKAVEEYVKLLEERAEQIEEAQDTMEDIEDKIVELKERGKQEYLDLEQRIYDALVARDQKVIDEYQELSDTIGESNDRVLTSLQESIDLSRQIRDNTKTEEDIAEKEARLAYLRRDTSGANDLEIMQLEKEIDEARQNYADTLIDQKVDQLSKDNQLAADQRAKQIEIMQSQLDYAAQSGEYWAEVYDLISKAEDGTKKGFKVEDTELGKILKENDNFKGLSTFGQQNWMDQLGEAYAKALEGEANWRVRMAEQDGSLTVNKKKYTFDADNQVWTDSKGNQYSLSWDSEKGYQFKAINKQTTTPNGNGVNNGTSSPNSGGNGGNRVVPGDNGDSDKAKTAWEELGITQEEYDAIRRYLGGNNWTPSKIQEILNKPNWRQLVGLENSAFENQLQENINKAAKEYSNACAVIDADITATKEDKDNRKKAKKRAIAFSYGLSIDQFKTGGLADFTGPAWLDGSKSRPEMVLNAQDTQNFIALRDVLSRLVSKPTTQSESSEINMDIDINVQELANDYDVDQLVSRLKDNIYQEASYRNINQIRYIR